MSKNNLFDVWDDASEEDFFALEKQQAGISKEVEETNIEDGKETEEETVEEEDFFKAIEDSEEEGSIDSEDNNNTYLSSFLKEQGYLEDDFEEELSDEELFDKVVKDRFEQTISMLPSKNKELISFLLSGGDVQKYLNKIEKSVPTTLTSDSDIEDEEVQELVAKEALKKKGFEDDMIQEQIELFKTSGKLYSFSKKEFEIWKEVEKTALEDVKKQQQEDVRKSKEEEEANIVSVKTLLEDDSLVSEFGINKDIKKDLPNYIYKKSVTLSNGVKISELQKDLFYEINSNPKALVQIATLLKNRNTDGTLNLKFLKNMVETKVTKDLKNNIRRVDNKKEKTGFERGFLADLFN